ncbi:alpha/beta fold hydrolase [Roseiarcus sp.]|uniref:alpha/beta fold hydrolase n=1 Tax=Roseiarcus sp. TaxID=1969460 RepID=UPI003F95348F
MPRVRANAIDIAYESLGRQGDPTILLIHGLATPLTGWPDSLCEGLIRRGFRVVRFDNRDIGRSTFFDALGIPDIGAMMAALQSGRRPIPPYPLDAMAADAAGLMDALGIVRAHMVGASMGGMIAQLVALNHPERTASRVSIMSSTGRPGLAPGKPEAMRALMAMPASPARADRLATAVAAVKAISGQGFPQTDAELVAYPGAQHRRHALRSARGGAAHGSRYLRPAPPRAAEGGPRPGARHSRLGRSGPSAGARRGHGQQHPRRETHRRSRHGPRLQGGADAGLDRGDRGFRGESAEAPLRPPLRSSILPPVRAGETRHASGPSEQD